MTTTTVADPFEAAAVELEQTRSGSAERRWALVRRLAAEEGVDPRELAAVAGTPEELARLRREVEREQAMDEDRGVARQLQELTERAQERERIAAEHQRETERLVQERKRRQVEELDQATRTARAEESHAQNAFNRLVGAAPAAVRDRWNALPRLMSEAAQRVEACRRKVEVAKLPYEVQVSRAEVALNAATAVVAHMPKDPPDQSEREWLELSAPRFVPLLDEFERLKGSTQEAEQIRAREALEAAERERDALPVERDRLRRLLLGLEPEGGE